ncbi:MAG: hypothetical protein ACM3PT_02815 [Deltaproteobacteria bacterium]
MKNIIYFLLLIVFFGLSSCADFTKVMYTKTKSIPVNYQININGDFNEEKYINEYDLEKSFDVPKYAKIEKVNINSVTLNLVKLPETDASLLDLEVKLIVRTLEGNTINYNLVEKAKYDVLPIGLFDLNKLLDSKGVEAIRQFIQKVVDPVSSPGSTTARVTLKGRAHSLINEPETIKANMTLNINATITFSRCEVVEFPIFGNDCD